MNSKRKGNAGELELLHLFEGIGIPCRRNQQGLFADFRGGAGNPDVLAEIGGRKIHCEVKRTEKFRLYPSLEQAQRDAAGTDAVPVVVHRQNRKPWAVVLSLDSFLNCLETGKAKRGEKKNETGSEQNGCAMSR